jgi:hypothetical protein
MGEAVGVEMPSFDQLSVSSLPIHWKVGLRETIHGQHKEGRSYANAECATPVTVYVQRTACVCQVTTIVGPWRARSQPVHETHFGLDRQSKRGVPQKIVASPWAQGSQISTVSVENLCFRKLKASKQATSTGLPAKQATELTQALCLQ